MFYLILPPELAFSFSGLIIVAGILFQLHQYTIGQSPMQNRPAARVAPLHRMPKPTPAPPPKWRSAVETVNRETRVTDSGCTTSREFIVRTHSNDDALRNPAIPKVGDPHPDGLDMRCFRVSAEYVSANPFDDEVHG